MGLKYVLDTNTCLYFLNQTLTEEGFILVGSAMDRGEAALSVITQMELLGFAFRSVEEERITEQLVTDLHTLPLSDLIVRQTIAIRKSRKIKLPDAIIAATAFVHDCALVTRNVSDFSSIEGLKIINPF
ncbi:type II toxin-antitoxin system VapC family toxin [Haliscomenobacter sp.]|uniref:type II toxin-antitoxin system VapC family toxin n=1 Tax=Haliscomenobacter sp. TaxID=2717303 RepID=UPI003593A66E